MTSPSPNRQRVADITWVAAQSLLLLTVFGVAPFFRGAWTDWAVPAIGAVMVALGAYLGIAGVHDLGANRTPFPHPRAGGQLVTTGIYAKVRHPLYASLIALGFGWALLWQSLPALALAAGQVAFFQAKARLEERLLRERFRDYADYALRVPPFFPRLFRSRTRPSR